MIGPAFLPCRSRPHPRLTRCWSCIAFVLAFGVSLIALSQAAILRPACGQAPPAVEDGYEPLFNGQSLAGWEGAGEPAEKCWKVDDGQIVCTGEKGPWLRSKRNTATSTCGSATSSRQGATAASTFACPKTAITTVTAPASKCRCWMTPPSGIAALKPYQYTGSVYAIAPAREHVGRPAGEWNDLEINCRGAGTAWCTTAR
jgi:hypothetical protein